MIPPRPHKRKYLFEPNSHESPLAGTLAASQRATVNGPLNGELRAAFNNESNILTQRFIFDSVLIMRSG